MQGSPEGTLLTSHCTLVWGISHPLDPPTPPVPVGPPARVLIRYQRRRRSEHFPCARSGATITSKPVTSPQEASEARGAEAGGRARVSMGPSAFLD